MKVGIIGAGAVGAACAKAMLLRGSCHEIALYDNKEHRAEGVAADLSHGEVLCPPMRIVGRWDQHGNYDELRDASIVLIAAGLNERAGNATNPSDRLGRLLLLPLNAGIIKNIVRRIAEVAPHAIILIVTDPPDPLADLARELTTTNPVLSTGTFLDTLRFRVQLARRLNCHASSIDAIVIGEHGLSQVFVWSTAQMAGERILDRLTKDGGDADSFQREVQNAVKFANIEIIDGTGASQHGIGIVTARLVEAILRNEKLVAPIGVFQPEFSVTLSLPAVIGRDGVSNILTPTLSSQERDALIESAIQIHQALDAYRNDKVGAVRPERAAI